jgi:hypothetical protein
MIQHGSGKAGSSQFFSGDSTSSQTLAQQYNQLTAASFGPSFRHGRSPDEDAGEEPGIISSTLALLKSPFKINKHNNKGSSSLVGGQASSRDSSNGL